MTGLILTVPALALVLALELPLERVITRKNSEQPLEQIYNEMLKYEDITITKYNFKNIYLSNQSKYLV